MGFQVPYFGDLNALELSTVIIGVLAVLIWFVTRHWFANNILGMSICMYMMTVVRLPSIKVFLRAFLQIGRYNLHWQVAAVLLTLLFAYDIFWSASHTTSTQTEPCFAPANRRVFYSEPIFGKNVMVTAAKGLDLPIKLVLPRILTPCNLNRYLFGCP